MIKNILLCELFFLIADAQIPHAQDENLAHVVNVTNDTVQETVDVDILEGEFKL